MKLHELSPAPGSVKDSYRKGRGPGSGNGKTAGKGHKGQPCSHSRAIPSFPSQLEWKIGLPWANTRGILNSPS